MNVLILSAAAKVLLVQAFQTAASPLGGRVIAADLARDNAALFAADQALILPRSDDPDFEGALLAACAREAVGLVVPTRDGELARLAQLRPRLQAAGVTSMWGNDGTADWCTVGQPSRFFSHRRDSLQLGGSGRFAACIWRS